MPRSLSASCYANYLGCSEGREAVHECEADMDFGGLGRLPRLIHRRP